MSHYMYCNNNAMIVDLFVNSKTIFKQINKLFDLINCQRNPLYCAENQTQVVMKSKRAVEQVTQKIKYFCNLDDSLWEKNSMFHIQLILSEDFDETTFRALSLLASIFLQHTVREAKE